MAAGVIPGDTADPRNFQRKTPGGEHLAGALKIDEDTVRALAKTARAS